ncbi:MAG: STAS domain-containing protein [Legionellaceae bacterium]|nr:STAS domain-containing protein [Legionellaceae bacterium]
MQEPIVFFPVEVLTFYTVSSELKRFSALLRANMGASFVMDLSKVLECDTAGLALLVEAKRLCALKHGRLFIKNMPDAMVDLATFFGIAHLFLGELVDG